MARQRHIPDPPPIVDAMTTGATGANGHDLVGRTILTTYAIPDSDRGELLLLLDNGRVILMSCDPGYEDDYATRTPDKWESYLADATDTPAGAAMKLLEPGEWL